MRPLVRTHTHARGRPGGPGGRLARRAGRPRAAPPEFGAAAGDFAPASSEVRAFSLSLRLASVAIRRACAATCRSCGDGSAGASAAASTACARAMVCSGLPSTGATSIWTSPATAYCLPSGPVRYVKDAAPRARPPAAIMCAARAPAPAGRSRPGERPPAARPAPVPRRRLDSGNSWSCFCSRRCFRRSPTLAAASDGDLSDGGLLNGRHPHLLRLGADQRLAPSVPAGRAGRRQR